MAEVVRFRRGIDPDRHLERRVVGLHREGGRDLPRPLDPLDLEDLLAGEPEGLRRVALGELQGEHPIRFDRWIRSKLSAMTARTPSSAVPLAAQSRDDPDPYSFPARITRGTSSAAYLMAAS